MSPKRTYQILLARCSAMNPAALRSTTSSKYIWLVYYLNNATKSSEITRFVERV
jgi:hypothetical protein